MSLWINFESMLAIFRFPALGRLQLELVDIGIVVMFYLRGDKVILRWVEIAEIRFNALIRIEYTGSIYAGV